MFLFLFWAGSADFRDFVELYAMHIDMISSGERFCREPCRERISNSLHFVWIAFDVSLVWFGLFARKRSSLAYAMWREGGGEKKIAFWRRVCDSEGKS